MESKFYPTHLVAQIKGRHLDEFTAAYVECMLWAESVGGEDGQDDTSFDSYGYDVDDIAQEALAEIIIDCDDFFRANSADISEDCREQAGHDFYLTRNGHGTGFWDRGDLYGSDAIGRELSAAAKVYGTQGLYLGDDGKIYVHN